MASVDDLSADERTAMEIAAALRDSGNLHSLIARLRDGEVGPEHARDALRMLAELDLDLLAQITLDALISVYLEDPGVAYQPRRVVRSEEAAD
jgi:hypothetical protein